MTSAVSMPIENVVTGMRPRGDSEKLVHGPVRASCPSSPRAPGPARPRPRCPARASFSARSSHVRCSQGERPATAPFTRANARLRRLEALVPALVRGGLAVAGHALGRQRQEAVLLLVGRAARDRPRVRELERKRPVRQRRRRARRRPSACRRPMTARGRADESAAAAADERRSPRREKEGEEGCVMAGLWCENPGMRDRMKPAGRATRRRSRGRRPSCSSFIRRRSLLAASPAAPPRAAEDGRRRRRGPGPLHAARRDVLRRRPGRSSASA